MESTTIKGKYGEAVKIVRSVKENQGNYDVFMKSGHTFYTDSPSKARFAIHTGDTTYLMQSRFS